MEKGWRDFKLDRTIVSGERAMFLVYDSYTKHVLETFGYYVTFAGVLLFRDENTKDWINVEIVAWKK